MKEAVSYSHNAPRSDQDKNGQIRTSTNRLVNPWNLRIEDIDILDIARHTSCETRYVGSVGFYSVAQHARLVADLVRKHYAPSARFTMARVVVAALLHDAEEGYLKDMPSPVKHRPEMLPYVEAGNRARSVIFQKFLLSTSREEHDELMKIVSPFDHQMYFLERKSFDGFAEPSATIERENDIVSCYEFLRRWNVDYATYLKELFA